MIQARSTPAISTTQVPVGQLQASGAGRPLDVGIRRTMEALFQADFSGVRVHEGLAARSIGALAFTVGDDLHFAPGLYDPTRRKEVELLGHELTHVVQQRAGRVANPYGHGVAIVQDPALEAEAARMAWQIAEQLWARRPVGQPAMASPSRMKGVLQASAAASSAPPVPAATADSKSVDEKRPVKAGSGALAGSATADILDFEMIRLGNDNWEFWNNYARAMRFLALGEDQYSADMKSGWTNAVKGFTDALDVFKQTKNPEVWIAVATHPRVKSKPLPEQVRIEMCMTVTTSPDVPFTTHMGIFKTPLRGLQPKTILALQGQKWWGVGALVQGYEDPKLVPVRDISLQLHAFAAKKMIMRHGLTAKPYMITAPLKKMLEIMKEAFGAEARTEIETSEHLLHVQVQVGNAVLRLPTTVWDDAPWVRELTDLGGSRPKVAIKLDLLASKLSDKLLMQCVLDWRDRWPF